MTGEPDETTERISNGTKIVGRVDVQERLEQEKPWKDAELINHLYHVEQRSGPEIAEMFGCSVKPIYSRIEDTRSTSEANRIWTWKLPLNLRTDDQGYEYFQTKVHGESKRVAHHRLIAVSHYGLEAVKGNIVHHKSNIPWDNRPENLELMSQSAHVSEHHEEISLADKLAMLEWSLNTDLTHREIAKIKDESRTTVNSIIHRTKEAAQ